MMMCRDIIYKHTLLLSREGASVCVTKGIVAVKATPTNNTCISNDDIILAA